MAKNACHFGFAVGQGDQLARDINISPRQRERIVHRRIEQCDVKIALRVSKSRLHGNVLADPNDIGSLRTLHRSAKLFQNFRVIFCTFILFPGGKRLGNSGGFGSGLCFGGNIAANICQSKNGGTRNKKCL